MGQQSHLFKAHIPQGPQKSMPSAKHTLARVSKTLVTVLTGGLILSHTAYKSVGMNILSKSCNYL